MGIPLDSDGNPQLEIVAQRWPDIEMMESQRILDALDQPLRARSIVSHSGRPTSAASLIRTDRGLVFIKRYSRTVRDVETIAPYHRYAEFLSHSGISTPRFLRFNPEASVSPTAMEELGNTDMLNVDPQLSVAQQHSVNPQTATVAITADAAYEAYMASTGEDRYGKALSWDPPKTLEEARNLGESVAKIDAASRDFDEPRMRPNGMSNTFGLFASDDIHASWKSWVARRPAVQRYIRLTNRDISHDLDIVQPYAGKVAAHYGQLHRQWTHGDPHTSNFLWTGNAPSTVIDFGLADRNTAVFDLAMAIERHAIQWVAVMDGHEDACRPDIAESIIRGYCSHRPLQDAEKLILPELLAICQAESGLNWLQYYMDGVHRLDDAAWCYDVCFLAHTRWFSTGPGRALLDSIRDCLSE
ncbi:MAG: phosphotransferase [Bifidobacterium sp.]|uniref:Phosphotransferase n=1 Tax=Bifidobacterium fermentum TaxID=3059035 RepID=A0AB39UQN1_9BIFI